MRLHYERMGAVVFPHVMTFQCRVLAEAKYFQAISCMNKQLNMT